MGKKRCFLGILASLFITFFTANVFADGYTCPEYKKYTSCNAGYYLNGSDVGNACIACDTANNTTSTQQKTRTCTAAEKATLHATTCTTTSCTQTCNGKYTGGTEGSQGVNQCTGCSSYSDCTPAAPVASACETGYYFSNNICSACSALNNTSVITSASVANGTRVNQCSGKYTGGAGGTNGSSACTGCSASTWTCTCNSGYHAVNQGTSSCSCEADCSTSKSCATDFPGYSGTYNECTQNQASQCSKSCSVKCSSNATCPANATCTWNTNYATTGLEYVGSTTCKDSSGNNIATPTCPIATFTCNDGYEKNAAGTACVAKSYAVTYKNGGGTGADQTQNVTYNANFTTKAASTFKKPGFSFSSWGGSYPKANTSYKYTTAGNTTLTAQWTICSASTTDGGCNCPAGQHPNGTDGCSSCYVSCSSADPNYPLGEYTVCSADTDNAMGVCYRSCTTADIANSKTVTGNVPKFGLNTCTVTACNDGYAPSADKTSCVAKEYTVTYSCGNGTGSAPQTAKVKYGAIFKPAANTCTGANLQFMGWAVSDTDDIKMPGTGFTWNYASDKTFTAQMVAHVCEAGEYHNGTACVSCPSGFEKSEPGATAPEQCYTPSTMTCINPGNNNDCPINSVGCYYNTREKVDCKMYYNATTCTPVGTGKCPYRTITCNTAYYSTGTECLSCLDLGEDSFWNYSQGGTGAESCYAQCSYDCNAVLPALTPEHATCGLASQKIDGGNFYPTTTCSPLPGLSCVTQNCVCETGYTFRAPTGTKGDIGECVANIYTVTLNDNGGTGGNGTVYEKYETGWSLTNFGTMTTDVAIPTRANHTFLGYFTATTGGDMVINAQGSLPESNAITQNVELYAQWSQNNFTCTAGKTAAGAECPAGSYCPGGDVPAGQEENTSTGCQRLCPTDNAGGAVTSAAGSSEIGACNSTRKIINDDAKHGSADQTCAYGTSAYDSGCSIKMTACYAGYYLANETDISCTSTEVGHYSPVNDLKSYACRNLNGADDTVNTADRGAGSPMECYNTCSNLDISNGVRVPVNATEAYTGTEIPACSYDTRCNTGYSPVAEACEADVYKITLNNGDDATPKTSVIYLKYNTGWYSDAAATKDITTVQLPTKAGGFTCYGYMYGNTQVVDAEENLTQNHRLFTSDVTITAIWEQNDPIHCDAGTYYSGTGTTCTDCPAGDYCEGVNTFQDVGEVMGRASCADLNGKYTSAKDADGNLLTTIISSAPKCESSAACFATNVAYAPASNLGAGRQTCKYNPSTGTYTANCESIELLTCVAGHWRANADDIDCSQVGSGYYSPAKAMTRTSCPNLGEVEGITSSETAEDVTKCKLGNIWYEPKNGHSGHRRACYHIEDETATDVAHGYDYNCDASKLVTCDAGYYYDGKHTIISDGKSVPDCIPVTDGWYSPAPGANRPNFEDTDLISTQRTQCPDNGLTGKNNAAQSTECYQTCQNKPIENGTGIVPSGKDKVYYTGTEYPACVYTAQCDQGFTAGSLEPSENPVCSGCPANHYCPVGGEPQACPAAYPNADSGATSENDCYRECEMAPNATSMTGRDYINGPKTCEITGCRVGTYLTQEKTCEICPAGHTCAGGTEQPQPCEEGYYCTPDNPDPQKCPAEFPMSGKNTASINDCYRNCEIADLPNSTAVTGTITKGGKNTCAATGCNSGSYMQNNKCEICPAGSVCNGGGKTECPAGSYCPEGSSTPMTCPGSHAQSAKGAKKESDCYKTCESYPIQGGTAVPKSEKAYYNNECEFEGRSDNGNPCEIVNDVCIETSCNSDYELIDGRCRKCVRENVLSYKTEGNCVPASCVTGYHPNGLVCEEDIKECTMPNATYAEQKWDAKLAAFGICMIQECDDGYHLASNACVVDEQPCTVENGTGVKEWNHATNTWGACVATSCDPGYTDDPSETNERSKPCGQCKNKFSVLGELAASSYIRGCEIASCMYQGEMYNLENNECVPICEVNGYEDETGTRKWDPSRKKCIRTCKEGYSMW